MTYNRPAYVPASTTVNYSFDVFADGVWIDSDTGALTGNAARWQGFAKPGAKIELRNVVLTPTAVSVKYVDENGAAVSMDASVPTTANVGAVYKATVKVATGVYDTSANSADVVVSGLVGANETFAPQNVATGVSVTSTANVAGNDFVVVTIKGLNKAAVTYSVTGLTDTALSTLNSSITAPTYAQDASKKINVEAAKTTGIAAGTPVTFTVTLDAAPQDADAYRVTISKLGIDGYVYTSNLTLSKVVNVNENITITASDVKVEPVALPSIQSVKWKDNSVTVSFTKAVDVQTVALAKKAFADNTAQLVDIADTEVGVLSITYQVVDGTLAAGDTLTLTPAKITGNAYGGALTNSETTITLQADGTGKLST